MKRIFINTYSGDILPHDQADIHKGVLVKDENDRLIGFVCFTLGALNVRINFTGGEVGLQYPNLKELMQAQLKYKFIQL